MLMFNKKKNNKDIYQLISSTYTHYVFFLVLLYWVDFSEQNLRVVLIVNIFALFFFFFF